MLEGKVVKASKEILMFLYPTYRPKTEVSFLNQEEDVIYVGKYRPNLEAYLKNNTNRFINTVGRADIDLSIRGTFAELVFSKWNKQVPKWLQESMNNLSDDAFESALKCYWVSGKWPYDEESGTTVFDLFMSMNESLKDNLKMASELMDKYGEAVIESSLITFLSRAIAIDSQDVNPGYKRVLKQFYQRSVNKIRPAILNWAASKDVNKRARVLKLIMELR